MTSASPQQVSPAQDNLAELAEKVDSLNQERTAESDTTSSTVDQFSSAFSEFLDLLFSGNWEQLYELLYSYSLSASGLIIEKGLEVLGAFLLLYVLYRLLDSTLTRLLDRSTSIEAGLQSLLLKTFRVVAYIFIGSILLDHVGVNITALIAGLSIAGIAVGFAARDSIENFISGVTVLVDQPFRVGDYIEIDGEYGQVDEITLRSTRIRTVRNEIMVLPNSEMITQRVINHTKRSLLRIDIPFGIAYKEYPSEAREVLLPLVEGDDRILSKPPPSVIVTEMSDSSVDMRLRFYISDPSKELPVRWEYTEKVREALREADIEIPFPHRQLFLDEAKAFEGSKLLEAPHNDTSEE